MTISQMVITLFFVANPLGSIPIFVALLKNFDIKRQQKILLREAIASFLLAVTFLFVGKGFMQTLHIETYSLQICGGTLILLVAINMIFPPQQATFEASKIEPFIVPIATPLLSGGGVLSTVMILAQNNPTPKVFTSCIIAWLIMTPVIVFSTYMQKLLGKRGLEVLEQIMGMVLLFLALQIIINGATQFKSVLLAQGAL